MTLQFNVCLKQLPTARTVIRSSVAVYIMFTELQAAGVADFCYTVNTCMVNLPCGLSCETADVNTDQMLSHTRDICMVSLHCEFYCAQQGHVVL